LFGLNLFITLTVTAQSFKDLTFGVSLNPTLTYGINRSSSNERLRNNPNLTYKQYADSVREFETYKISVGLTGWVYYPLNVKWNIQAGLGYSEVGFTRRQENIKIGDKLFPGIGTGVLLESSNTTKNIDYAFRYQYLSIPVLFNYYGKRSRDFSWSYYLTGGAAINMLVKSQVRAKLDNFYVEGKNIYSLDSTGYEGRRVAVNLFVGGKAEYRVDHQFSLFVQPLVTFFPLSVSKTVMKSNPIGVQVNCGVTFNLNAISGDE
jgi:hypothetical protein